MFAYSDVIIMGQLAACGKASRRDLLVAVNILRRRLVYSGFLRTLVVDFSGFRILWCTFKKVFGVLDPDPHGSALIWLYWIRILIGNADPDPRARKYIKLDKQT